MRALLQRVTSGQVVIDGEVAGRTGKGRHFLRQTLIEAVQAFSGPGRHEADIVAAALVKSLIAFSKFSVEIALIEAEYGPNAAVFTGHEHLVDKKAVRIR